MSKEVSRTPDSLLEENTIGKCADGSIEPSIDSLLENCDRKKCADGSIKIPLDVYKKIIKSSNVFSRTNVKVNINGRMEHEFERKGILYKTSSEGPIEYF